MAANTSILNQIVERAKAQESQALEELYQLTHNNAYYTAVYILKNEQDAQDAIQDSYITAFTCLHQLTDNNVFEGWLTRIVANRCKDMLKKKRPVLFQSEDEQDYTIMRLPELQEDFLPEEYITQETKRQQVLDILNKLSDVQRTTILLFYYDELTVKEIASIMECSESTVTSRISYAKKFIKQEVEKLEKKGDKLYTLAPIPFLRVLFAKEAAACAMSGAASGLVLDSLRKSTVQGTSAKSSAGTKLLTKIKPLPMAAKGLLIGACALIAIGCVAVPTIAIHNSRVNVDDVVPVIEDIDIDLSTSEAEITPVTTAAIEDNPDEEEDTVDDVDENIVDSAEWKQIYLYYMQDRIVFDSGISSLELIDLDNDGIPELVYYDYLHGLTSNTHYTITEGEVVPLIEAKSFLMEKDTKEYCIF